ncbi:hypothetical protein K2Q02_01945 [Patescibacteria group bacterium]|nr:hypothetical protein [Patescibacteria group bacterium]
MDIPYQYSENGLAMLFKKKNKEVTLTNSTVKIFTVAQQVLKFISGQTPFEILHGTVSLRDLNRTDDCKRANAELLVKFSEKTTLNIEINMLFKKEVGDWVLADPEIMFSHREDGASALIAEKDGSYRPSCEYSAEHVEEIRKMI